MSTISVAEEVLYFENFDCDSVITPVDVDIYKSLLRESGYDKEKSKYLINGFRHGFRLEYQGDRKVKMTAPNLKLDGVGSQVTLWNKVMKEVQAKCYTGPFKMVPFDYYIQSPIGLVPKDGRKDTRLIFHLSYPRNTGRSVNANIPKAKCSVQYPDFADVIRLCMIAGKSCKIARSDMRAAFRNLGMLPQDFCLLVMKAVSPLDGETYWFFDKALAFGSSISCTIFQEFSNSIAHIMRFRTKRGLVNYLDDYLFVHLHKLFCNKQVDEFIKVCKSIHFPVSMEKTFWASTLMVFLGMLIDTVNQTVSVPLDKVQKAFQLINTILSKKKITVCQIQQLCGYLNFLGKCIVPGQAFTRRLYAHAVKQGSNGKLLPHHHVQVNSEMKMDLEVWRIFLQHQSCFCRPFMDFSRYWQADEIDMFSDATSNKMLGYGAMCAPEWCYEQWCQQFIETHNPNIAYLELYAVTVGVLNWIHRFANRRVVLFCDNQSVVAMLNPNSSNCRQCMVLIRIIVLKCLTENVRVFAKYVSSKSNICADLLSRQKVQEFRSYGGSKCREQPRETPKELWPMGKLWLK